MSKWREVATQGAQLKREQLYAEIGKVQDAVLRSNLEHTYCKLFSFLDDDLIEFERRVKREARGWQQNKERKMSARMTTAEAVHYLRVRGLGTTTYPDVVCVFKDGDCVKRLPVDRSGHVGTVASLSVARVAEDHGKAV